MAITVYTGVMGSGKSYEAVSTALLNALRAGRRVVTNVSGLNKDKVFDYLGGDFDDDKILVVHSDDVVKPNFFFDPDEPDAVSVVRKGDLVLMDEVWAFWGTDQKILPAHQKFFRMHRHYTDDATNVSCDLVILIQDLMSLHRNVRSVVETNMRFVKLKSLGLSSGYRVEIYEGNKQTKARLTSTLIKKYDKAIFPLYQSYEGGKGKELSADDRQNIFKSPWFVATLVGGVVLTVVLGVMLYRLVAKMRAPDPAPSSPAAQAAPALPAASSQASSRLEPKRRLVGLVTSSSGDSVAIFRDADGTLVRTKVHSGFIDGWSSVVDGGVFVFGKSNESTSFLSSASAAAAK